MERSTRYLKIVPLPDGIKVKDVNIAVALALFNVPPGVSTRSTRALWADGGADDIRPARYDQTTGTQLGHTPL